MKHTSHVKSDTSAEVRLRLSVRQHYVHMRTSRLTAGLKIYLGPSETLLAKAKSREKILNILTSRDRIHLKRINIDALFAQNLEVGMLL